MLKLSMSGIHAALDSNLPGGISHQHLDLLILLTCEIIRRGVWPTPRSVLWECRLLTDPQFEEHHACQDWLQAEQELRTSDPEAVSLRAYEIYQIRMRLREKNDQLLDVINLVVTALLAPVDYQWAEAS